MKLSVLAASVVLLGGPVLVYAQELDSSFQSLKDAVEKSDAASVKKLAVQTFGLAQKAAAEPAPAAEADKKDWTDRVGYAQDVESYSEYALFAIAAKSQPATVVDLMSTLEDMSPKSKYLDEGYLVYFNGLNQTGQAAKIPAIAEKAVGNFPENGDLLLLLAEHYKGSNTEKALTYANRLVAAVSKETKPPEGVSQADWDKKKNNALGHGYWIAGVISGERNAYSAADKDLRAALPYIRGDNSMMAPALFYLGVANYNLGKMELSKAKIMEGVKFSQDCAAITGPLAEQAWKNAAAMKTEADKMR